MSAAAILAGHGLDLAVGDPRRGHPVAGFGAVASSLERATYRRSRAAGLAHAGLLTTASAALGALLARRAGPVALAACLWASLGGRSLVREGQRIAALLDADDVPAARAAIPALVGRDPSRLDSPELCRAAVESLAENTVDAVVAPLLWAAVGGAPAVAAHRAINTLDAMIGHRDERYARFGWAAARADDVANWPAARLTAAATVAAAPLVGGSPRQTARIVRRDGAAHPSPNGGRAEAAFAGALGVRLGGRNAYPGGIEDRPRLGDGPLPGPADVQRAARLSLAVGALGALVAAAIARWRG